MKTRSGKPVHLIGYEELLSVPTIAGASDIPLEQLHEFKNHPFHLDSRKHDDEFSSPITKSP